MSDRLVVHAHVPLTGSGLLNRNVFFRSYTRDEIMFAYGDDHGQVARLPSAHGREVANRLKRVSAAIGHVPYGYFDGLGRWTIYVSVFDDPVRRFLAFVGSVMAERNAVAETLFGTQNDPLDPERMIEALLDLKDVQLRQTNVMTRIAAGLPAFAAMPPSRGHLNVARANVVRCNYLVSTRDEMPVFEAYLAEVLGVSTEERCVGGWSAATPLRRKTRSVTIPCSDVSARLLRRIEAANDLDMRLYEAVVREDVACRA